MWSRGSTSGSLSLATICWVRLILVGVGGGTFSGSLSVAAICCVRLILCGAWGTIFSGSLRVSLLGEADIAPRVVLLILGPFSYNWLPNFMVHTWMLAISVSYRGVESPRISPPFNTVLGFLYKINTSDF